MNAEILTQISISPCSGHCLRQVSAEHYGTQRVMQAGHLFSPARAETRDSDKNFNVTPVSSVSLPVRLSTSPRYSTADSETCHVVFSNLPLGITIDDVANKLRTPPREGSCGVSIVSSAALPWDSVSFVVQFESPHEARIARLGWDGLTFGYSCSAIPAPQSLLSTVTLTPYRPKTADTFVEQNTAEPGRRSCRGFAFTYNHQIPIAVQSHHPFCAVDHSSGAYASRSLPSTSPASRSSRPGLPLTRPVHYRHPAAPRAVSNSSHTRNTQSKPPLRRADPHHNSIGYMRRKGLIPWQN